MIEVRLHGTLAREFGKVWHFDIATPREAVYALECARTGFRLAIEKLSDMGLVFRVRTPNGDRDDSTIDMPIQGGRLDIIPIVQAASTGVRFVVGAVLLAASFIVPGGPTAPWNMIMRSAGTSLMLTSVVEWLTPIQKKEDGIRLGSWTVSGAEANIEQGNPIAVIYGEVLTPGFPISGGTVAAKLSPSGTYDPAVNLGGQTSIKYSAPVAAGTYYVILHYTGAPFNISEPYTWSWSHSGFASATSFEVLSAVNGAFTARVGYRMGSNQSLTDSGSVVATLKGRKLVDGSEVTVNGVASITVLVDTLQSNSYRSSGGPYKVPTVSYEPTETGYA